MSMTRAAYSFLFSFFIFVSVMFLPIKLFVQSFSTSSLAFSVAGCYPATPVG